MSRYSARRLAHNRFVRWTKAVEQWNARPYKIDKKGKKVLLPSPTFCHTCYYRKCRCFNE